MEIQTNEDSIRAARRDKRKINTLICREVLVGDHPDFRGREGAL